MYAKSVIERKLKAASVRLGWAPEYHSTDEVDKFNRHYSSLLTEEKNNIYLKRDLTEKEIRWIRNERAICFSDQNYWATRYAWIYDAKNEPFRYKPRVSQMVLHDIFADLEEQGLAIEAQILKGRQQGTSTEIELKFIHRLEYVPGTQAIVASVSAEKSELMARMFYTAIDRQPYWMVPDAKKDRRGQKGLLELRHGSIVSIQSGNQQTGIAQGWTPTCIHISEACDYSNPQVTLEEGLMRATHSSPKLFQVYESTGNGDTGWWADLWRTSKEFYPLGRSRLMAIFLPWWMATDLYPEEAWLRKFPIPSDWKPAKETIAHATKCRAFVVNTPYIWKRVGLGWHLPAEQMWFWEFNYQDSARKHAAKSWLRQMPADDVEALTGKNDDVFGGETIEVLSRDREKDYEVFGIIGEGVHEQFEPDPEDVDYNKPRIEINWRTPRGEDLSWMLLPLHPIDEKVEPSALGKLLVFERPHKGCDYAATADTSDGVGGDRSILNFNRIGLGDQQDVQVCEFGSDKMNSSEITPIMACISAWYAGACSGWGVPLMGIEQRRKPGDDCQNQLLRMGFRRHFKFHRLDGKKPDEDERRSTRLGWYTNEWSRPYMMGRLIDALENFWFKVNSPFAIREIQTLQKRVMMSGKSRMEHMSGMHDDRVFACGISYVIAHTRDVMIERSKIRYDAPRSKTPPINLNWYNPFAFKIDAR